MRLISIHLLCLLSISCVACYEVTDRIDFEKKCNGQMYVHDYSIVEIFAYPQSGIIPETSSCQTRLVATPPDRKLILYFHEFFLGPGACGHKLKIYDGDKFQNDPARELTCNSPLTKYTSKTNEIIISFTKPSVDTSRHYKFNIKVTTDRAAPLTGPAAGSSGGGLTSGAIAGIAVGCVVGAVIIIAICIYALWKFMRQAEEKKRYGANEPPPVFVTSEPPMSNCGIAPGSSRRSFKTHSHVAFSEISKKSEIDSTSSDAVSKSKSSKSYDNHGYSNDGTSVASSNVKAEHTKVVKNRTNDLDKEEFVRGKNDRGSYRKDRREENVNYPDVVDSARKSEKEKQRKENISSKDMPSRENSMKRSVRNKHTERSESLKRNERDRDKYNDRVDSSGRDREKDVSKRHKSRDNYEYDADDRDRGHYNDRDVRREKRDRYQNNSHQNENRKQRHKTESEYTDDSGATYPSSVSDRYRDDRRSRPHEKYDNRKYHDDHTRLRDSKRSERSSSQKRGRSDSHRRRHLDEDEDEQEDERMRHRREEKGKQRSHSTSRARSYNDQLSDQERYRDSNREQRSRRDDERDSGLRRQQSSRSQSGRHRSRSSFR